MGPNPELFGPELMISAGISGFWAQNWVQIHEIRGFWAHLGRDFGFLGIVRALAGIEASITVAPFRRIRHASSTRLSPYYGLW